jgi:hypothetical protein
VVFDENVAPSYYVDPVNQIRQVAYVMGEILDSAFVKNISIAGYAQRTTDYLNAIGSNVDIWEIGNEINGEWLGNTSDVVAKMTNAYGQAKGRGLKAALTLYYNQDCWSTADHEMFTWAGNNVPADMKTNLDYVLVSYYEHDCNNLKPDWQTVFTQLHQMFPNSKIGFGESGSTQADKQSYLTRYYTMHLNVPNYVGGYFWWYWRTDMVPYTGNTMWNLLNSAIQQY